MRSYLLRIHYLVVFECPLEAPDGIFLVANYLLVLHQRSPQRHDLCGHALQREKKPGQQLRALLVE